MEIKTEADSNNITECPHDDKPTTGVFGLSDAVFSVMPMTHTPETGTENPYQKTCTGFLQVCHANRYQFFLVPKSGTD